MTNKKHNGIESLEGEATLPGLSVGAYDNSRRNRIIFLFVACVLLVTTLLMYASFKMRKKSLTAQQKMVIASSVPQHDFNKENVALQQQIQTATATADVPQLAVATGGMLPALDKSASSLMVDDSNAAMSGRKSTAFSASTATHMPAEDSGNMSVLLSGTHTATRLAGMLGNRNFILAKGAFIDCVLQTRLSSDVPGMTSCVVTRNIYSDNGKVVLIERGSTVSGEYQSNLHQGMKRIYVLWDRVKTPDGVVINLDSPGTDSLGGAGVPGYIDTHFWDRFGGALMLSLVDDVGQAAVNSMASKSDTSINFGNTAQTGNDMAAEALKNSINIPPTLYKNQGENVGIYVARDLDFSSVYSLTTDGGAAANDS